MCMWACVCSRKPGASCDDGIFGFLSLFSSVPPFPPPIVRVVGLVVVRRDPSCNESLVGWLALLLRVFVLGMDDDDDDDNDLFPRFPKSSPWREDRSLLFQTPE